MRWRCAAMAFLLSATAHADSPPSWRAGRDLIAKVPEAAMLDGGWSISRQINTLIVDRGWAAPTVQGLTGHFTRRILYGTTWTLMLAGESVAVVAALGSDFEWLGAANYRLDWLIPVDLSACPRVGANGGCGIGTGGFSFLQLRPRGSHWWFEAGGGNTDQRVGYDALRTTGDSTWVLTPIAALREFATVRDSAVAVRFLAGGGIYGGMHNASMHPSTRGADAYPNRPWTELYPLEGGIGPGARVQLTLTLFRHLELDANLTVAPFLVYAVARHVSRDVAPLDLVRSGMPIWRKADIGIGYRFAPFTMYAVAFAQELSERDYLDAGSRGGLLRFDIPLR